MSNVPATPSTNLLAKRGVTGLHLYFQSKLSDTKIINSTDLETTLQQGANYWFTLIIHTDTIC
jgi:hypothetical protein